MVINQNKSRSITTERLTGNAWSSHTVQNITEIWRGVLLCTKVFLKQNIKPRKIIMKRKCIQCN